MTSAPFLRLGLLACAAMLVAGVGLLAAYVHPVVAVGVAVFAPLLAAFVTLEGTEKPPVVDRPDPRRRDPRTFTEVD